MKSEKTMLVLVGLAVVLSVAAASDAALTPSKDPHVTFANVTADGDGDYLWATSDNWPGIDTDYDLYPIGSYRAAFGAGTTCTVKSAQIISQLYIGNSVDGGDTLRVLSTLTLNASSSYQYIGIQSAGLIDVDGGTLAFAADKGNEMQIDSGSTVQVRNGGTLELDDVTLFDGMLIVNNGAAGVRDLNAMAGTMVDIADGSLTLAVGKSLTIGGTVHVGDGASLDVSATNCWTNLNAGGVLKLDDLSGLSLRYLRLNGGSLDLSGMNVAEGTYTIHTNSIAGTSVGVIGEGWSAVVDDGYLGSIDLTYTVPEPATMGLLGLGGLVALARRKR